MKKISILLLTIPGFYFAQLATPQGQMLATENPNTGFIGIGTTNPLSKLDIDLKVGGGISSPIIRGSDSYISSGLRFIDDSYTQPGQVKEWAIWKGNTFSKGLSFMRYDAVNRCEGGICDIALQLNDNGNVGIGNASPQYKLDVNGSFRVGLDNFFSYNGGADIFLRYLGRGSGGRAIVHDNNNTLTLNYANDFSGGTLLGTSFLVKGDDARLNGKLEAREIKVTTTPTADFVFEDSYQLPNLESVEKHIKEKKHLPEIASAAEMQKEGVNIGDFQIKLLQKIEELTLYQIQLNKEVTNLKQENIQLKETLQKIQNHEKSY
ncbi:hypothetical protein ELOC111193_17650 [Elizabethkingia occulta]|uniref:Cell wall anchor protein n=1 Tax=Elizabethkingia occulta TaxID=1867263 RepID=A0A1T3MNF1_9FLAO|nr:hypothetical protein [Elizabethkingia occulta]OPB85068.1 hypothetical protein BB020_06660 [Elizabethkingia occulta]OPC66094.1 hypothetical protein BAZ10_02335 [Elizabethkingia occulta]